jgi:hypothetical protein
VFGIFGHKWEEMTGGETNLHDLELRKNLKFHGIMEFHDVLAVTIPPFPQMPSWCVLLQMWL